MSCVDEEAGKMENLNRPSLHFDTFRYWNIFVLFVLVLILFGNSLFSSYSVLVDKVILAVVLVLANENNADVFVSVCVCIYLHVYV